MFFVGHTCIFYPLETTIDTFQQLPMHSMVVGHSYNSLPIKTVPSLSSRYDNTECHYVYYGNWYIGDERHGT